MNYTTAFEKMGQVWDDLCSHFGPLDAPSPCDVCEDWIVKFDIVHLTHAYYLLYSSNSSVLEFLSTYFEYDATISRSDIFTGLELSMTLLKCVWKNYIDV